MLFVLILHCLISVTCLLCGFLVHRHLPGSSERTPIGEYKSPIIYLLTGLISFTAICQWVVLFFPLNAVVKIVLFGMLLMAVAIKWRTCIDYLIYIKNRFLHQRLVAFATMVTWLLIILLNAGPTIMDDTESYHIQMIKWIEEFGSVPGIVNLHERYGFNSSWFTSIAFFRIPVNASNFYTGLNGTISLWFTAYLLFKIGKLLSGSTTGDQHIGIAFLFIFVLAFFTWPMLRGNAATANYDFITTVAVFVLFAELLTGLLRTGKVQPSAELIIWPVYLFTVRIINYPFLLLTLFAVYNCVKEGRTRQLARVLFFILFLIVPFLVRNVILSGYPFYPSLSFNWFSVDWKPEKEKIIELLRYIKYFNRVNAGIQNIEVTEKLGFPEWIFSWFRHLFWYDKLVLLPGIAGLGAAIVYVKRIQKFQSPYLLIFLCCLFIQLVSWFLLAPDPRFVYGTLLSGVFAGLILLKDGLNKNRIGIARTFFYILIVVIPVFMFLKTFTAAEYRNWLQPLELPQPPLEIIQINNARYYLPTKINNNWNRRCYAAPLPCIYEINPALQMRGDSLSAGFRINK